MRASFAQPIGGGKVFVEEAWRTWKFPTVIFASPAPFKVPARGSYSLGDLEIPGKLKLPRGRYRYWQICYPAFNTETWLVSNVLTIDVP